MILFTILLVAVFLGGPALLACPVAKRTKSWYHFVIAFFRSLAGVVLPLVFFVLSFFLTPESKDLCHHGRLDCFFVGKGALIPVALFATASLYEADILRAKNPARWVVSGIFLGAIISVVCFVHGVICLFSGSGWIWLLMLVPLYVAIWYSVRTVQLIKAEKSVKRTILPALAASLPFWVASWLWSVSTYKSLPDADGCFVVSAASRGHERLVGPFTEVIHNGRTLRANQQLIIFWELEDLWKSHAPRSHHYFRRVYNRLGPVIARHVVSPWQADAVCAALKPLEWTAKLLLKITPQSK